MTKPPADSQDLIRVHGARENNLSNVSLDIPKRRLTVFTGVSGSGKSSLVFGTIAAESQRLINETYSAFVQGVHADAGAARRRLARGADDRDHRRPGADGRQRPLHRRHGHRRQRDAADRLQPARPAAHRRRRRRSRSTSRRSAAAGAIKVERGGGDGREPRTFSVAGGMCPRCEGMGSVNDIDLTQLYDESKSLDEGAITIPGYTAGRLVRPHLQPIAASSTRTSRSATTPRRSCTTSSTRSRPRSRSTAST